MTWEETLERIHSPQFDAELNVVSGTNGFFRAVRNEPAVQRSLRFMREQGELREEVLGRIYDLTIQETDPLYENPYDTALAVLLWLTRYAGNDGAFLGAQYVDRAPRCWYAHRLAQQILNPPRVESSDRAVHLEGSPGINFSSSSKVDILNMTPPFGDTRGTAEQTSVPYWSALQNQSGWEEHWYAPPGSSEEDQTRARSSPVVNYAQLRLDWDDASSEQTVARASGVVP